MAHLKKFGWRLAVGSGKSADHFLHHVTPLLKNRTNEMGDVKMGWRTSVWN
jgi:hypothetical protein